MRSIKAIRAAKIGSILLSVLTCALGLLLALRPGLSLFLIGRVVGATMVVFGVVKLVGYFAKDLYRLAFQFDLAFGILLITVGAILLAKPLGTAGLLCAALGVVLLADGLLRVQTALDARRFGLNTWWLMLALAVITGAVGALLALCPATGAEALTQLLGISLLAEGALNLCVAVCAIKIVAHQRPDVIEGHFI